MSDAVLFLRYVGISLIRPTKRQNGVHCQQIIGEILNETEWEITLSLPDLC